MGFEGIGGCDISLRTRSLEKSHTIFIITVILAILSAILGIFILVLIVRGFLSLQAVVFSRCLLLLGLWGRCRCLWLLLMLDLSLLPGRPFGIGIGLQ